MTSLSLFKNSTKKELEAEREKLRRSWNDLAQRERAFHQTSEFGRIHMIPTDRITTNPNQPRKQFDDDSIINLADSIRQYGILQPLTVRRIVDDESFEPIFEIIAGERRFRAGKMLGFATLPCIMINADSKKSAELAIVENIQRENLNMFEQACAIASLIDLYKLTQEEVARRLSTSQSFIANKLRILRLTLPEREMILKYNLTERHARALLKIQESEQRTRIIEYINAHNLNVATTEAYIDRFIKENECIKRSPSPRKIVLKDIRIFSNTLKHALETMQKSGISVSSKENQTDEYIEYIIRIAK